MKKYSEQLLIIGIALLLHFSFGNKHEPFLNNEIVVEHSPLGSWLLDAENLVGDTLISIEYDPYFKSPKTYRAFPLKQNLQRILKTQKTQDLQLIFKCADGYQPHMPLSQVMASEGFLAYRDATAPEGKAWADGLEDKFAPFYLVWPEAQKGDKSFVTPYGLERIVSESFEEKFADAMPKNKSLVEGFTLFSNTCMRCHLLNKVGGSLAPELNYPKNITEYWTKEDIWAFIQEPTSFRFNSKMPPITTIDRAEFEKIYAYLSGMKDNKGN